MSGPDRDRFEPSAERADHPAGRIRVEPLGVTFELRAGESLMAAAERAGYYWPTICKGNAQCNRCRVRVVDGSGLLPPTSVELDGLRAVHWRTSPEDPADRLGCQMRAVGDAIVHKRGVKRRADEDS